MGLRAKLVLLLLGFGVFPLGAAITIGYVVTRGVITERAEVGLQELAERQAAYLATELSRERLLLRTIAGQLPGGSAMARTPAPLLSRLLVQGLPEGGVFDGLRLVGGGGRVLAGVALRNTAPHWPSSAPAADWTRETVAVHRSGAGVLAYLLAVPAMEADTGAWLEGHVRREDFERLFAIPEHLMGGAESAVFERSAGMVFVAHAHAARDLAGVFPQVAADSAAIVRARVGGRRSLVATAPVAGTSWAVAASLPVAIALAPLARLRNAALIGCGVLVVLIVVTGAVAAGSVTTPLAELASAARRFGQGKSYGPLPEHPGDEVGQLIGSFRTMAADLGRSREEIERLHARELERAQQLATVGELASGVAHEIRNPITGVRGALDLALRKLPPDDAARLLLEEAQQQVKRIEGTTTQLLRYARPPELREVVVDANLLVDRAARVVEAQATSAGVALRVEAAPGQVPVQVDPELMVQVLVNLMLNGIEAMTRGEQLTVWVGRHAPEAWIGVRDTGPGVPPDARLQVFRPFFTTKHKGTGLGLSISQQIVMRHGGTIRVEDAPGGGATFVVAIPLAQEGEHHEDRHEQA